MDRRRFLTLLAVGVSVTLGEVEFGRSIDDGHAGQRLVLPTSPSRPPPTPHRPAPGPPDLLVTRVADRPTAGIRPLRQTVTATGPPKSTPVYATATPTVIDRLPADGPHRFALTIDDGASTEVLDAVVDFVIAAGIRMTFFVNGVYRSWTAVRAKLAPLVESGQVQLGNHTWNHPSITELSKAEVLDQLQRNEHFLRNTYGVEGRPYFRPPYGHHNARTDRITGGLGYYDTAMWYGSLNDATVVTPAALFAAAAQWFGPRRIVIGHANHPAITYVFPELVELIRARNLQTVTLRDAFGDSPTPA